MTMNTKDFESLESSFVALYNQNVLIIIGIFCEKVSF